MLRMKPRAFQLANGAAAVVWVLAVLAPGYFAAKGLARLEALGEADPITIAAVVAGFLVVGGLAAWQAVRGRLARQGAQLSLAAASRAPAPAP
jgi:membrane protein DedA with SNARE-associated domain